MGEKGGGNLKKWGISFMDIPFSMLVVKILVMFHNIKLHSGQKTNCPLILKCKCFHTFFPLHFDISFSAAFIVNLNEY